MNDDIHIQRDYSNHLMWGDAAMTVTVIAIATLGLMAVYFLAIPRQETADCLKWQQQAQDYPNFYLTQWQADQCKANGISINAPIK